MPDTMCRRFPKNTGFIPMEEEEETGDLQNELKGIWHRIDELHAESERIMRILDERGAPYTGLLLKEED